MKNTNSDFTMKTYAVETLIFKRRHAAHCPKLISFDKQQKPCTGKNLIRTVFVKA